MQIGNVWLLRKPIRKKQRALTCGCCGRTLGSEATQDHFIPRAFGGADAAHNLWPLHRECNAEKGAQLPNARETMRFSQLKGFCNV